MQDYNFSIKIVNSLRVRVLVYQDHALTELSALKLELLVNCLNTEADGLTGDGTLNWSTLMMNALDHDRVEFAALVRTQEESVSGEDGARFDCTSDDNTDTRDLIHTID
jgi:hypothetical protein